MKTKLYILLAILFLAISAPAHPLGNFSINQFSKIEVEKSAVKIRQVFDIAEIPTFQLRSEIDTDKNGVISENELNAYAEKITPVHLANLALTVNDQPLEIRAVSKNIALQTGAGNLPTLRIELNLSGNLANLAEINQVNFSNKNFAERLGWNEIVVNRTNGINIFDSTAFGSGVTDELKAYPQESLNAPLAERNAQFSFSTNAVPTNAKLLQNRDGHTTMAIQKDRLAELIALPEITPAIALFGLLLAFGHGKAVVGAYLIGSRGTPKHAAFLGLTVTITHTLGVFALGLITLFASNYILPEKIMPFLSFVSGLLVLYIGLTMFKSRLFSVLGWEKVSHHHGHGHSHDHEHHHGDHSHDHHSHVQPPTTVGGSDKFTHTHDGHTHSHLPPDEVSWKSLLALGISGGLLPCPSALVLMLSAINLGRIGYGLILTTAFSFGLAATLTAVGLLFLYGGKLVGGSKFAESRIIKTLPVFSALVIACLGAVICYNSLG
jgi:nickel/cobalt transporter (NicO) family protein